MNDESEQTTLLSEGFWLQPGPATAVVRDAGWIILVPGIRKEVLEAAWTVLGDPPAADELVARLAEEAGLEGPGSIKSLLFGLGSGTDWTIGVKGDTPVAVYTADGAAQVIGTDEEPLVIQEITGLRRAAFGDLPSEDPCGCLRVREGMVRTRGFVHMTQDPAELDDAARADLLAQVEKDGRSIESPEEKERKAKAPKAPPRPVNVSSSAAPPRRPMLADRDPALRPSEVKPSRPAAPEKPAAPSVFDGLFGPSAAPAAAESTPEPDPESKPAPAPEPEPESKPAPAPVPTPAQPTAPEVSTPGSAPASSAEAASQTAGESAAATPHRRLVRTSLFDRPRARTAASAEKEPAAKEPVADESAGKEPVAETPAAALAEESPAEQPMSENPAAVADTQAPASTTPPAGDDAPAAPQPTVPVPTPSPAAARDPEPAPEPVTDPAPEPQRATEPPSEPAPEPSAAPEPAAAAPVAESAQTPTPAPVPAAPPAPQPGPVADPGASSAKAPSPASAVRSDNGSEPDEESNSYDDLFGKTMFRSIEDAAVRAGSDEDAESQAPEAPSAGTSPDPASAPRPEQPAATEPAPAQVPEAPSALAMPDQVSADHASSAIGGDFIDWVPGVGRAAPEIANTAARRAEEAVSGPARPNASAASGPSAPSAPPAPASSPVPAASPHAPSSSRPQVVPPPPGGSVSSAPSGTQGRQRPAPTAARTTSASGPAARPGGQQGPTLAGRLCQQGHANPPERSQCTRCGQPTQDRTLSVERPPLGQVDISTGGGFLLDRGAVIGRRPRASRVSGDDVPQLVTVPSPQQDISRTHLELRLEGWHVIATDLGATNGTALERIGQRPRRMPPREGVVLHDGDRIDLGDGVVLTVKGLP